MHIAFHNMGHLYTTGHTKYSLYIAAKNLVKLFNLRKNYIPLIFSCLILKYDAIFYFVNVFLHIAFHNIVIYALRDIKKAHKSHLSEIVFSWNHFENVFFGFGVVTMVY